MYLDKDYVTKTLEDLITKTEAKERRWYATRYAMTYVFETVDGVVTVKHNKHMPPDEAISVMLRNRHGDLCDVKRKQHAGLMRKLVDALYKTHDALIPHHVLDYDAILRIVGGAKNEA